MQGNASWLSGFLFSISCFQGWSLWTELLCSTSLRSVECQFSGTTVPLPSRHRKSMASLEQNVGLLSTRAPAAPCMDFPRWNPFCCVWFCTVLRSEPWMCASSNTAAPVNSLPLCQHPSPSESCRASAFSLEKGSAPAMQCLCSWHCLFHGILPAHGHPGCFQLVSAFPAPSNQPSPRSSCLGQKPGFWVRKINLNGCSSEFNDPC